MILNYVVFFIGILAMIASALLGSGLWTFMFGAYAAVQLPAIASRLRQRRRSARSAPRIVVLCGSTRFRDAFERANYEETLKGNIVLDIGWAPIATRSGHDAIKASGGDVGLTPEQKLASDELHKRKIDLADEVLVLNVGGYVGRSTAGGIEHARRLGKPIRWLEAPRGESVESGVKTRGWDR